MKLKAGLKRVLALLPKEKGKNVFNRVRFTGNPSTVFVTDGICSSTVFVDEDIPSFVCDADILKYVVKDKGELSISVEMGKVVMTTEVNRYDIPCEDASAFPLVIHPSEDLFIEHDLTCIDTVIHGASKNSKANGLPFVHFTKDYIEATDRTRLVKVLYGFDWVGTLPIELFNKWPSKKGEQGFYADDYRAYFKLGEEYRICTLTNVKYPSTEVATKLPSVVNAFTVGRKDLLNMIVQATDISEVNGVLFEIGSSYKVKIKALGRESVLDSYVGELLIEGSNVESKVSVNGKLLQQSLKKINGRFITCIYNEYPNPFVVRSGDTLVYIWPMLN